VDSQEVWSEEEEGEEEEDEEEKGRWSLRRMESCMAVAVWD